MLFSFRLCSFICVSFLFFSQGISAVSAEQEIVRGMVEAHNRVRAEVGSKPLQWSDKLARKARVWAGYLAHENGCVMQHRPSTGKYGHSYGENLYWASAVRWSNGKRELQDISADRVVQSWASEAVDYSHVTNSCKPGKSCGHYTQVIWSATEWVGCARAVCADLSQVWVCNYYPAGNVMGQKPY